MSDDELDQVLPKSIPNFIAYKITCIVNGKEYIGITRRSIAARWADHREAAQHGKRTCLARAMHKHGIENFTIQPFASAFTFQGLLETEKQLIVQEQTLVPLGYNIMTGGIGYERIVPFSADTIARMSKAHLGKKQSAETIAKRVEKLRGRKLPPRTPEQRAAQSAAIVGRKWSSKMRAKMEGRFKGRIFTPEWKAKISAAKKGIDPRTPEQIAAHGAKMRGKKKPPRSAEHRAKLGANTAALWAKLREVDPSTNRLRPK